MENQTRINKALSRYKKQYKPNELTELLVILIELLDETNEHLENMSNGIWEK